MTQRGKTGVVRINRGDVSGRVAREERARTIAQEPNGLLVVIHGVDAGVQYELHDHAFTIGRENAAEIHVSDPAAADTHARLTFEHGHWVLHDLGSASGTFVNDERVTEYVLRDGDRIRIGRSILKLLVVGDLEKRAIDELFRVDQLDGLTLASNTGTFMAMLVRDVAHARRYGKPLSLVRLDIDGFRRLNESHGETMGNQMLQQVTSRLRGVLRKQDFFARIGDDEFAILLSATGLDEAVEVADKLRHAVESGRLKSRVGELNVTISGGVSTLSGAEDGRLLAERAERAMQRAQKAGGNQITVLAPEKIEAPRPASQAELEPLDDEDD